MSKATVSFPLRSRRGLVYVYWRKDRQKWQAQAHLDQKHYALGCYRDEIDAALACEKFRTESMPLAAPDPELVKRGLV